MNRENYNRKTLCVFDNIGSFFVDTFYNGHYIFSRELVRNNSAESITEAYRNTLLNYNSAINKQYKL